MQGKCLKGPKNIIPFYGWGLELNELGTNSLYIINISVFI